MPRHLRPVGLALTFLSCIAVSSILLSAQDSAQSAPPIPAKNEDSGWRISPNRINIQMGNDRPLQLLDDQAQELHGAQWAVDNPDLADIQEEDGLMVLHAKAVGTVRVSATLNGEMRFRDIKIWSALRPLPLGTTNWGLDPIGREAGDMPAVPTEDGPSVLSLEQTTSGDTYLRGDRNDGIQMWTWLMPEKTHDVELICGDWLGGALISATKATSFTLYAVGKDGKLRWQHTSTGLRKGLAISTDHILYLISQSAEGTTTSLTALDEAAGKKLFELPVPASEDRFINVKQDGATFTCTSAPVSNPARTIVSRVFVNMDGFAYLSFTQNTRKLSAAKCKPGSTISPADITLARDENLMLWQIHQDGSFHPILVENYKGEQPLTAPISSLSPTNAIVTDNMNGMLIPVQASHQSGWDGAISAADEFIYRVDQEGELVYKYPLPKYTGTLRDEMVIGTDDTVFATRGGLLIAFSARTGKDVWRWDSNLPEISVFAALANGHCLVQTDTALVEVESSTKSKEVAKGQVMMGWQGQMYRKH
jgi:outer membrane protein assembly factor BamB